MLPSQQRLAANQTIFRSIDLRLVLKEKFISDQRMPKVFRKLQIFFSLLRVVSARDAAIKAGSVLSVFERLKHCLTALSA